MVLAVCYQFINLIIWVCWSGGRRLLISHRGGVQLELYISFLVVVPTRSLHLLFKDDALLFSFGSCMGKKSLDSKGSSRLQNEKRATSYFAISRVPHCEEFEKLFNAAAFSFWLYAFAVIGIRNSRVKHSQKWDIYRCHRILIAGYRHLVYTNNVLNYQHPNMSMTVMFHQTSNSHNAMLMTKCDTKRQFEHCQLPIARADSGPAGMGAGVMKSMSYR